MGYLHIENLYKNQDILLFRECYALEKIHGTSAHIAWRGGAVVLSSGGESSDRFKALFDMVKLHEQFTALGYPEITVFGEAYGGKQQGQSWRYGKELRFVAFDVKVGDLWLSVPQAEDLVRGLGLEFVYYERVATDLVSLDAQRDQPSVQAHRNGVEGLKPREGVVLRPLVELHKNNGERIISKHKRAEERETEKLRGVVDPAQLEVLTKAEDIAMEWVTPTRLEHVLDKMPGVSIEKTKDVIERMIEDVEREAKGEIVTGREARQAIGRRTVMLFKKYLHDRIPR